MDDGFGGRQWQVTVEAASKAIQASQRVKEQEKQQRQAVKRAEEKERVLATLRTVTVGQTAPDIAELAGVSKDNTRRYLQELLLEKKVVKTRVAKGFGSAKKSQPGWLLWRQEKWSLTDEQIELLRNGVPIEDVLPGYAIDMVDNLSSPGAEG